MALLRDGSLEQLGFRLSPVGPGVHERSSERSIRTTKDHLRCTIHGSPTPIPGELLHDALEWVVLGLNQTPNVHTDGRTPWSIVYNEKLTGNHFSVPFGTLVLTHDPMTQNSLRARSQYGIVIGREEMSSALKVYLFGEHDTSDRRVRRDAFQVVSPPYTQEVQALLSRFSTLGTVPIDNADDWIRLESHAVRLDKEILQQPKMPSSPRDVGVVAGQQLADVSKMPSSPRDVGVVAGQQPADVSKMPSSPRGVGVIPGEPPGDAAQVMLGNATVNDTDSSNGVTNAKSGPTFEGVMTRARSARLGSKLHQSPPTTSLPASCQSMERRTEPTQGTERSVKRINVAASRSVHDGGGPNVNLAAYFFSDYAPTAEGVERHANDSERRVYPELANGYPHDQGNYYALLASKCTKAKEIAQSWSKSAFDFDHGEAGLAAFLCNIDMDAEALAFMAAEGAPMFLSSSHLSPPQREAFMKELHQLTKTYDAFEEVDLSSLSEYETNRAIPTVTLVLAKHRPDGSFDKWKARLVTKGFADAGNSGDTSSPTVASELVAVALNYAVSYDLDIDIMDVGAAFLEATLDRNVYVRIAKDSADEIVKLKPQLNSGRLKNGELILRLKRALYGLRDSPRAWYDTLSKVLYQLGFHRSEFDPCLFFKFIDNKPHLVLTHVDDILSTGPRRSMAEFRNGLKKAFQEVKMNINPSSFGYLGCHLERDRERKTISIRQTKHIEALLERLSNEVTSDCATPSNERLFHVINDHPLGKEAASTFASVVMTMLYITKTRPDIKCAVIFLSTRLTKATVDDYYKMLRVARYLKATKNLPSVISASDMQLRGSADASHGVHADCKSHSGGLLWFGKCNAPVTVISRKQTLVTRSSTTAEIVALDTVAVEVVWLRKILQEVKLDKGPVTIQQDNQACILMVTRGYPTKGSHAADVRLHYTKSKIDESVIALEEVRTDLLLADGLTKPLSGPKFSIFCAKVLNLHALK